MNSSPVKPKPSLSINDEKVFPTLSTKTPVPQAMGVWSTPRLKEDEPLMAHRVHQQLDEQQKKQADEQRVRFQEDQVKISAPVVSQIERDLFANLARIQERNHQRKRQTWITENRELIDEMYNEAVSRLPPETSLGYQEFTTWVMRNTII